MDINIDFCMFSILFGVFFISFQSRSSLRSFKEGENNLITLAKSNDRFGLNTLLISVEQFLLMLLIHFQSICWETLYYLWMAMAFHISLIAIKSDITIIAIV